MIYDKKYVTQNMAFLTIAIVCAVFFLNQFWEFYQDNTCIVRTYSRNLLEGNGLIWTNGERVEECTQFLWVFFIAAVYHRQGEEQFHRRAVNGLSDFVI